MSNMQQAQQKIYDWLKLNRAEYCSSLNSGLTIEEINNETNELPFKLTQELYQLYQWKNGSPLVETGLFSIYFLPCYLFLSLQKNKEEYYQNIEIFEEDWNKDWFPIFSLEGYSYFTICQNTSVGNSPIWFYDYEQPEPMPCYDSLTDMMCMIAECYETKAYYLNPDGLLKEDKHKVAQIQKKYNST